MTNIVFNCIYIFVIIRKNYLNNLKYVHRFVRVPAVRGRTAAVSL